MEYDVNHGPKVYYTAISLFCMHPRRPKLLLLLSLINIVESVLAAIMMFAIAKFSQFMFTSIIFVGLEFLLLDISSFIAFAMAYVKIF
jgi:hypothetical protein